MFNINVTVLSDYEVRFTDRATVLKSSFGCLGTNAVKFK